MKRGKSGEFKGFGKQSKKAAKKKRKKEKWKIFQILDQVDRVTSRNKANPQALENFKRLVREGHLEKLCEYFEQYGISPEITKINLDSLISEELRDLSD